MTLETSWTLTPLFKIYVDTRVNGLVLNVDLENQCCNFIEKKYGRKGHLLCRNTQLIIEMTFCHKVVTIYQGSYLQIKERITFTITRAEDSHRTSHISDRINKINDRLCVDKFSKISNNNNNFLITILLHKFLSPLSERHDYYHPRLNV